MDSKYQIKNIEELCSLYGTPSEASLKKQTAFLQPHYQSIIKASPFVTIATLGEMGLDVSPRGDAAGFVRIIDDNTLAIPDRRGNNRLDSLRNIIHNPQIALLFFVPGLGETLRVNGTAYISAEPELLASFAVNGREPATVLVVKVESAFFQCSRAIKRSGLWNGISQDISQLPTPGKILEDLTNADIDGDKYDRELPARIAETLY